jgi:catechol 2,3-dioxygenase-like lactoylglutathione lyase family enzyme
MTVIGVDFVSVPTQDLERAVAFYGETLGLHRSVYKPERNFAEFETGTVTLSVVKPELLGVSFHGDISTRVSATWRSSAIPTAAP